MSTTISPRSFEKASRSRERARPRPAPRSSRRPSGTADEPWTGYVICDSCNYVPQWGSASMRREHRPQDRELDGKPGEHACSKGSRRPAPLQPELSPLSHEAHEPEGLEGPRLGAHQLGRGLTR